jgi:hypothetical protein
MGWARGGDCGSTSPRSLDELSSGYMQPTKPVMIAPLSIDRGARAELNVQFGFRGKQVEPDITTIPVVVRTGR